jgi:hypothetical protein
MVGIRFAGFTNDLDGDRWAGFTFSNGSAWPVIRSSRYEIDMPKANRWTKLSEGWAGGSTLAAGASEVLWMTAPTNWNIWRATFTFSKDEGTFYVMVTESLLEVQKLGLPLHYRRRSGNFSFPCDAIEK